MGKREDQAKIRKMRKRHRFAVFSGSTTRFVETRVEQRMLRHGDPDGSGGRVDFGSNPEQQETKVLIKQVIVPVGKISFSNQVVNGGKSSVNSERMETYYERIRKKDDPLTIADLFGIRDSQYQAVWDGTPKANRVNLLNEPDYRIDMFWAERRYFLVEVDMSLKVIKRSRDYGKPERAKAAVLNDRVMWVEKLKLPK